MSELRSCVEERPDTYTEFAHGERFAICGEDVYVIFKDGRKVDAKRRIVAARPFRQSIRAAGLKDPDAAG